MIELAGNELQYFFNRKKKSAVFRQGAELTEEVDRDCLRRAAMRSIRYFPKFKTRPVITPDGKVFLEENHNELPIFPEDGTIRKLGTDETAGFLFRVSCVGQKIYFSCSHALTDGRGGFQFLFCLLYEYFREKGIVPAEAEPLVSEEELASPYLTAVPADCGISLPEAGELDTAGDRIFHIPEALTLEETEFSKKYEICMEKNTLLRRTKETGTTPLTFLFATMAQSISELYEVEGSIVAAVPVDLHSIYQVPSQANFTETVSLFFDETMKDLPCEEAACLLRSQLNEKKRRDVLLARVAATRIAYDMIRQLPLNNEKVLRAYSEKARYSGQKMTFLLSNVGEIMLPEVLRPQVKDVSGNHMASGFSCSIIGYGSTIRLLLCQEWTSEALAEKISETLRGNGVENTVEDCGLLTFDEVVPGLFKQAAGN